MNPSPTDAQWLVLYMIDEGDVFLDGLGLWRAKTGEFGSRAISGLVNRLYQLGLVDYVYSDTLGRGDIVADVKVNKLGFEVLKRRSVYDVLERANRRARK